MPDPSLLTSIIRGSVTAPAGCGKTHLIAQTLTEYAGKKPILILTHTNAGVASLRARLSRMGVPSGKYQLYTLDGYSIRLIATFPVLSNLNPDILELQNTASDYPAIRNCAKNLLASGNIDHIIKASYSHLIVDEYQDCSLPQHELVCLLTGILPTCVLGDPMQAIFGFRGNILVDWEKDVLPVFPAAQELTVPWRWYNVAANQLGDWLLDARVKLMEHAPLDLRTLPDYVTWHEIKSEKDSASVIRKAAQTKIPGKKARALILCDSMNLRAQRELAGHTPGASTIESVEMRDLISFGRVFSTLNSDSIWHLFDFIKQVIKKAGISELSKRIETLQAGTARKEPSKIEQHCLEFIASPSYRSALNILQSARDQDGASVFRPTIYSGCIRALRLVNAGNFDFEKAVKNVREQYRLYGRNLPMRGVGSTLLLKGLEADIAVVTDPGTMDSKNLYVAITRGSERLVICSPTPVLNPP